MDKKLLVFFCVILLPQCLAVCKKEEIQDFVWSENLSTPDEKTSNPMCLDKNYLPVTRMCNNTEWTPSMQNIRCEHKQNDNWRKTFCPLGFSRMPNTTVCFLISSPQKWSDLCLPYPSFSYQYIYPNLLYKMNEELRKQRYWLPIRRDNRLDYVTYKTAFRYNVNVPGLIISNPINGNCLMYNANDRNFYLSNCDNRYSMLCILDVEEYFKLSKYHCPQGSYTTFNPEYHNQCYRVVKFDVSDQLLRPLVIKSEQEQFLADRLLVTGNYFMDSRVLVNIMAGNSSDNKSAGVRYFNRTNWIENSHRFSNWDSNFRNARLDTLQPYTTIRNGKWQLVFDHQLIQYAIQVNEISSASDPEFIIHFDKNTRKLLIDDTNHDSKFFQYSCFLNGIKVVNMSLGIGRKDLRCEGFTMQTLKLIKSPTIEVWSDKTSQYEIFVVTLNQSCIECDFMYESRNLKYKTNVPEGFIVQFRKIIDIDTSSNTTKFTIHCLVKKLSSLSIENMVSKVLHEFPHNIHIRHIDTCLGNSETYFNFPNAQIGDQSTNQDCQWPNGDQATLKCVGDSDVGAYWENDIDIASLKCNNITILHEIYQNISILNPVKVIQSVVSVTHSRNTIESLEYTIKIIDKLLTQPNGKSIFDLDSDKPEKKRLFEKLMKIYDNAIATTPVQDSIVNVNLSSDLTKSYQKMIESYIKTNAVENNLNRSVDGTYLIREPNIILLVIDPSLGSATGMSIHREKLRRKEMNFKGFTVKIHHGNTTTKDIIDRRLEAGINLHYHTISKLRENNKTFRIVLSVFYKNWFMEKSNVKDATVELKSKIVGVFIPEYPDKELPEGVSTILKILRNQRKTNNDGCSNWQIGSHHHGWSTPNLSNNNSLGRNLVRCPIKFTSFSGYVQMIGNDKMIDCDIDSHANIIKYITIFMSILSVVGVILIFIASFTIPAIRNNEITRLILCLTFAHGLQILVYILLVELKLFNADGNEMIETFCLATGAILHYLTLVGFFLSLFATDHLIRAYVIGANQLVTATFEIKVILLGWMLPILVVSLSIFYDLKYDTELYLPIDLFNDDSSICYPVEELLLISIHIPIGIIIILHLIIFGLVVIRTNRNPNTVISKVSRMKDKIQMYVYMFSILSITWLFAVIVYYVENYWVHLIFSYLFAISAPSQAFQIFLVYVAFNGQVRIYFKRLYLNTKIN